MKKFICAILSIIFISLPTFAAQTSKPAGMLEIREIQTRYFDTTNVHQVMKAVVNTLQDNGFIIQNIDDELGYLRAKKDVKLKRTMKSRVVAYSCSEALNATLLGLSFGLNPSAMFNMYVDGVRIKNEVAPHPVIFDSNVTIERVGKRTKVRFSVIEKVLENADGYTTVKSSPRKVVRHYEQDLYQEFFNQVSKNLFLEHSL